MKRNFDRAAGAVLVAVTSASACTPKEHAPSPPAATISAPPATGDAPSVSGGAPPSTGGAPQPKLSVRFRDLAVDGHVAYLKILAQDEEGSDRAWGLTLARFTDGCLGDDAAATIVLDLDGNGRARPAGVVHPLSMHVYPAGEPVPTYEETLTRASRVEIRGRVPPRTDDGIGHGDKLGTVTFDVQVPEGSISGETVLVDCGR